MHGRTGQRNPTGAVIRQRRQYLSSKRSQRSVLPVPLGQQIVGTRQRQEPCLEPADKILKIVRMARRLRGERLHSGECVLDAVVQLVDEHPLAIFGLFAFSNVDQHVYGANEATVGIMQRGGIGHERDARPIGALGYRLCPAHLPVFLQGDRHRDIRHAAGAYHRFGRDAR
jgi:hypothetical protein